VRCESVVTFPAASETLYCVSQQYRSNLRSWLAENVKIVGLENFKNWYRPAMCMRKNLEMGTDGNYKPTSGDEIPRFADVATFMRLPRVDDPNDVDIALIGVPFDGGSTTRPGARYGPRGVRSMSSLIRAVHPVTLKSPFDQCRIADLGDVPINPVDLADTFERIQRCFENIWRTGASILAVGGDHSVTLPIMRAICRNQPLGMVHFDAHSDTDGDYFAGSFDHHGTQFRRAVEEGLLDPARSIQIGLRGSLYHADELCFARESGMRLVSIEEADELGIEGIIAEARRIVGDGMTYVSFDIDCLDPAYASGTGTPEVGGFTTREAQQMVRGLRGLRIAGADVVEVAPPLDPTDNTALVGATMMFELLCVMAESNHLKCGTSEYTQSPMK
jgi:guanidinopropionase